MVQLTEEQRERLRHLARQRGVSVASLVRDAIDAELRAAEREARWERLWSVVGKFRPGDRPLEPLKPHDEEWADAIEGKMRRGGAGPP